MLIHIPLLLGPVTRKPSNSTTKRALRPVTNTLAEVLQLALRLLRLAALVLLPSAVDQALVAKDVSRGLLHAAHRLVIFALRAVLAILRDTATADGERAGFGGRVGRFVLSIRL